MKEERFFYAPELAEQEVSPSRGDLEGSEANHALRVLRLGVGDEFRLMDGKGTESKGINKRLLLSTLVRGTSRHGERIEGHQQTQTA